MGTWDHVKQLRLLASVTASDGVRQQFTTLVRLRRLRQVPAAEGRGARVGRRMDRLLARPHRRGLRPHVHRHARTARSTSPATTSGNGCGSRAIPTSEPSPRSPNGSAPTASCGRRTFPTPTTPRSTSPISTRSPARSTSPRGGSSSATTHARSTASACEQRNAPMTGDDLTPLTRGQERLLEELSPFELKTRLLAMASSARMEHRGTLLDAGRGNPNWIATAPREAFFALGEFALTEARRDWDEPGLAGMPRSEGSRRALRRLARRPHGPAGRRAPRPGRRVRRGHAASTPTTSCTSSSTGSSAITTPARTACCVHAERIVHDYLVAEMCAGCAPEAPFDLFAVEGGTAAMCYIFDSLAANYLLGPGDTVALMVPGVHALPRDPAPRRATATRSSSCTPTSCDARRHAHVAVPRHRDRQARRPGHQGLFVVNPSNPPSVMLAPATTERIVEIVAHREPRPDDRHRRRVRHLRARASAR